MLAIVQLLSDGDPGVCCQVLVCLSHLSPEMLEPHVFAIVQLYGNADANVRHHTLDLLSRLGPEILEPHVLAIMQLLNNAAKVHLVMLVEYELMDDIGPLIS